MRRGLLLALRCMADGALVHDQRQLDDILATIEATARSKWIGLTLAVVDCFGNLRGTRYEGLAVAASEEMLKILREHPCQEDVPAIVLELGRTKLIERIRFEDRLPSPDNERPVRRLELTLDGFHCGLVLVGSPAWFSNWPRALLAQMETESSEALRAACVKELGDYSTEIAVRSRLLKRLESDPSGLVQCEIIYSLRGCVGLQAVHRRLTRLFQESRSDEIRGACAWTLGVLADRDETLRNLLANAAFSAGSTAVRGGAIRGLRSCMATHADIAAAILRMAGDAKEPEEVRVAALWNLEDMVGESPPTLELVRRAITEDGMVSRVGAELLGRCMIRGRVKWVKSDLDQVQQTLMALDDPCPCALRILEGLVEATEVRRIGLSRENRLRSIFDGLRERLISVFLFGSAARGEQHGESDLDLLVIGHVSLRELADRLRHAEQDLGKQVNAVIYTPEEWAQRLGRRDPFAMRVATEKKVLIIGEDDDATAVEEQ